MAYALGVDVIESEGCISLVRGSLVVADIRECQLRNLWAFTGLSMPMSPEVCHEEVARDRRGGSIWNAL